jgi:hypothetical protein
MNLRKYLLDEHVNPVLRSVLHRQFTEMVVWMIGDPGAPARGTSDTEILSWCEANDFSLVTSNRTSMPVHLQEHLIAGRHIPGIFILNPNMTIGETVDELALIWWASEPDEYSDLVNYLPVSS